MSAKPAHRLIRAVAHGTDWTRKVTKPVHAIINPAMQELLAKPSWSVRSLLPKPSTATIPEVTREKLHHLLRLSALPLPGNEEEEKQMLKTLEAQIHFVKEIQKVDTSNVEPLQAIRDETAEAIEEQTVRLADLQPYLDMEEKVGRNGTVRRRKNNGMQPAPQWDPFDLGAGSESRKTGKYFVVKRKKPTAIQTGEITNPG